MARNCARSQASCSASATDGARGGMKPAWPSAVQCWCNRGRLAWMMDITPPLRPVVLLAALLAACTAAPDPGRPPPDAALMTAPLLPAALQLFPQCEPEIRAFIEMTRFARSHGENWMLFSDAIDAMKAQVVACVDDGQEAAAWTVPDARSRPRSPATR